MAAEAETQVLDQVETPPEGSGGDPQLVVETPPESPLSGGEAPSTGEGTAAEGTPGGPGEGAGAAGGEAPSKEDAPPGSLLVEIDGKEEEIPVEELVRGYQLARQAHEELQVAREAKATADGIIKGLIQDHWGTYHKALTGVLGDPDKALERIVAEVKDFASAYGEFEKLPREQQEMIRYKRKLAEREAELEQLRTERVRERESEQAARDKQAAIVEVSTAMKKAGMKVDLKQPSTRYFIQDVAREVYATGCSVDEAVKKAKAEVVKQLGERLKVANSIEDLEGLVPDLVEGIRKKDLNGVKRAQSARVVPSEPALKRSEPKKPVVLGDGDWEKYFHG